MYIYHMSVISFSVLQRFVSSFNVRSISLLGLNVNQFLLPAFCSLSYAYASSTIEVIQCYSLNIYKHRLCKGDVY